MNRTTLRAALGRLASARLLTVRQGSGYVVQDYREVAGLELLPELTSLAEARDQSVAPIIADLLEVRRRMAQMAFERLAARARDGALDTSRLEAAVDRFCRLADEDASVDAIADADLAITAAVLDATGSLVLGLILNPVGLVVREVAPLRAAIYREPKTNAAAYQMLLSWLNAPTADAIPLVMAQLERRDAATIALFDLR